MPCQFFKKIVVGSVLFSPSATVSPLASLGKDRTRIRTAPEARQGHRFGYVAAKVLLLGDRQKGIVT